MQRLRTNYRDKGDAHFVAMLAGEYPSESPNTRTYTSGQTKGVEVSVTFNPSQNWRMVVSGSSNQITATNLYPDTYEYLYTQTEFSNYSGIATWKRFATELRKVAAGQISNQFDLNPTNPVHVQQASQDATFIETNIIAQERKYSDAKAAEGTTLSTNGKYAANGIVTYSFTQGRMKGWQLGLNGRWRSASIAGYERFPNPLTGTPEGTVDRSHPIKGGEFFELGALLGYQRKLGDRIRLHLQLNIENLFDEQTPILRSVGTDSLGVFGPQYAIVPLRWELHRPRNYRFSATFEF